MLWDDLAGDPRLGAKRNQLATNAVRRLAEARMVNWNRSTGMLQITDLGRIAAKYYIRLSSIEIFNQRFKPKMSEADVLRMLSHSTEVSRPRSSPFSRFLTSLRLVRPDPTARVRVKGAGGSTKENSLRSGGPRSSEGSVTPILGPPSD